MLYNGAWGTVCDNEWDNLRAKVVCRQLGFSDVGAIAKVNAHFGEGSGSILIDYADCSGTETSLDECKLFMGYQSCEHYKVAGVICGNKTGKYVTNSNGFSALFLHWHYKTVLDQCLVTLIRQRNTVM